ncbi:MAG: hypothetical protein R3C02_13830 [Planctomycetaceae bacterium]
MDSSDLASSPELLQQQLGEKDKLIQALTGRLEDAAEQLDRMRRNGSDRGVRVSGGGASAEFYEQQQTVLENLSATVERWDEIQPREAFDRLEIRLDDLRSLLESALDSGIARGGVAPKPSSTAGKESRSSAPAAKPATEQKEPPKKDALSGWEAMKAQLMSGGDAPPPAPSAPAPSTPAPSPAETQSTEESPPAIEAAPVVEVNTFAPTLIENVPGPDPVDFETADQKVLIKAVEVRDDYIAYLTRRLQNEAQRTRQTINWESLNNASDDLKAVLQGLEADLRERLRIAEVDLSLERAKLSRIRANVESVQKQVEKRMKEQVANRQTAPAQPAEKPPAKNDNNPKGWLSSLGLH